MKETGIDRENFILNYFSVDWEDLLKETQTIKAYSQLGQNLCTMILRVNFTHLFFLFPLGFTTM